MTIEKLCGIETDAEYIARTTEDQRINDVKEYICGIVTGKQYEGGYSVEAHVDEIAKKGYWGEATAQNLKAYLKGFVDGFERGAV